MLVENQMVEVKWNGKTKKHYEDKGYVFTKIGDSFQVLPGHLTLGSKTKVSILCDYCDEEFERQYTNYNRQKEESKLLNLFHKDACFKCYPIKSKGLNLSKVSTLQETEIIKAYQQNLSLYKIIEKYSIKESKIYELLKKYNIETKRLEWTSKHTEILKNIYENSDWEIILDMLSPFKESTIISKACELKLTRRDIFTDSELELLFDNYIELDYESLQKLLPNRTLTAIMTKANRLGLRKREMWSDKELKELKEIYPLLPNSEIVKLFEGRNESSIASMAYLLKLKKKPESFEYYKEEVKKSLLVKLKDFSGELGRTPMLEDITANADMPGAVTYFRYFGSYVAACELAGLERNISNFGKANTITSINGDICLSIPEKIITDMLIINNIPFKKEEYYKNISPIGSVSNNYRCDWYINGIVVEYFGMFKDNPDNPSYILADYYRKTKDKIKICEDNDIPLIDLYSSDMRNNCIGLINKFKSFGILLENKIAI